ncbi:zinc-binding alcohol dehydrogenase family protein [Aspergillus affinis]|uniref:zinc-binding alcohol dehydrogenase family protein n=1 Tax=Aspergillus affinis TaxID=1070780 RepID=UPI0022FF3492|nr:putative alcohol dehydrogenase [Aspergillus affinis]KAI9041938.1 putative alcohol dehydrogenase [Aspergillus affinis]
MQKAIVIQTISEPARLVERSIPEPGKNQILLHVTAASLNPLDQKTRDVGLFFKQSSQVLAHDIAGEVIQLGPDQNPPKFKVGDHVFAHANFVPGKALTDCGGLQQYAIVDARFAAKLDAAGLTDNEAATIPVCAMAAFIALFHSTGLGIRIPSPQLVISQSISCSADDSKAILVIGGGSNCGRFAIAFARMCGFEQIITVAARRTAVELRELGATHVIDRHASRDDIVRQVREIADDGLVYALDTVNIGPGQELGLAALSNSKRGCLITLNPVNERDPEPSFIGKKIAGYERRLTFGFSALYPEVSTTFWNHIPAWVTAGYIRPLQYEVVEGLDVVRVNHVLDQYREGQGQKTVVRP